MATLHLHSVSCDFSTLKVSKRSWAKIRVLKELLIRLLWFFFRWNFPSVLKKETNLTNVTWKGIILKVLKSTGLFPTIIQNKFSCARLNKNKKLPLMLQRLGGGSGQNSSKERHWTQNSICMIQKTQICRTSMTSKICVSLKGLRWWIDKPGWLDLTRNQQT